MTPGTEAVSVALRTLLLGLLLPGLAVAGSHQGHMEARELLERMVQALRSLNYSGTFVYLHGSQLEALSITRQTRDGQVRERLVSLNGSAREVQRDPGAVTCVMPEARAISIDRRDPGSGLWKVGSLDLDRLGERYLLHPLGDSRVAGRATRVVGIIPKDELRYGYRFYLDRRTGLPLKTDLMDRSAHPIEQIMFTSLELEPDDPVLDREPRAPDGFRRVLRDPPHSEPPDRPGNWSFVPLPAGFRLQLHDRWQEPSGEPVEHYVLSDGLASVSVYMERDSGDGLQGGAHIGAVNAWGRRIGPYQVTAVGEVPADTVHLMVENLRYRSAETPP